MSTQAPVGPPAAAVPDPGLEPGAGAGLGLTAGVGVGVGVGEAPVYGLLAAGGVPLALPLALLREVVPAPAGYQPVPLEARGLLGTFVLRGRIIPVVDLARLFTPEVERDGPEPAGDGGVVAVIVNGDRVLGLLADEVRGIARVADSDLQPLTVAAASSHGDRPLFRRGFSDPAGGAVVCVLDGDAVFALPGIPVAEAAAERSSLGPGVLDGLQESEDWSTLMLFDVGGTLLGIDVQPVATIVPSIELEQSVLEGSFCRGSTAYLDRRVAVADPLAVTGLGRLAEGDVHQGVVLRLARGFVVLALSDIHAVVRVRRADLRPLPTLAVGPGGAFAGLLTADDGRHYLVLDHERLTADADLDALAALNLVDGEDTGISTHGAHGTHADRGGPTGPGGLRAGTERAGGTYLAFDIGQTVAAPLGHIVEILARPADLVAAGTGRPEVLGTFVHRDELVPLVDLARVLRPALARPLDATARALLVRGAGGTVAFAVPGLRAIHTSTWEGDPAEPGDPAAGDRLGLAPLLQLDADDDHHLIARLDLVALADELTLPDDATLADALARLRSEQAGIDHIRSDQIR